MIKHTLTALLFAATLYAPHALAADASPFVPTTITTGNEFAENTVWYTLQIGENGFYISQPTSGIINLRTAFSTFEDADLWCFVGNNTDGYRIYNKAEGTSKVLAADLSKTGSAGGDAFVTLKDVNNLKGFASLWTLSSSNQLSGKTSYFLQVKGKDEWKVNNRNGKLAFWTTGKDHGSSLQIYSMGGTVEVSPQTGTLTSSDPKSSYKNLWKSQGATPLTLNVGANNMNVADGILQLHAGGTGRSTYTFSAPLGYVVKSVNLDLQLAEGGKVTVNNNGINLKLTAEKQHLGLDAAKGTNAISFELIGDNKPVRVTNVQVVVERVKVKLEPQTNLYVYQSNTPVTYRIPAIAVTGTTGAIVAFSDSRHTGTGDVGAGRVDLFVTRSEDNGKTWNTPDVLRDAKGRAVAEGTGRMVNNDPNQSRNAGYGDAAVVADRESDDVLVLSVSGFTNFFAARRNTPNAVARWYSKDGGKTFTPHEDITEQIYKQFDGTTPRGKIESMFFGSGRIMQSHRTKVGTHYRLYAVMSGRNIDPNNIANWVMYSDDFGKNWKILGNPMTPPIPHSADEPKCEELPDGSIVVSSRRGYGRWFNIFRFTDTAKGQGYWDDMVFSPLVKVSANACNGEMFILPVVKKATNEKMYLALQSVPFGPTSRTNVGINYKELANANDFSSSANFAKEWDGTHMASYIGSAYSVMAWQKNNTLAFMYEEETFASSSRGGYTQVYKNYTIEQITDSAYSYAPDADFAVANELTKKVVDARLAAVKQSIGTGISQYTQETADHIAQLAAAYKQHPSTENYEAFNLALKEAAFNEVTIKQYYSLQNDGYKSRDNKSYFLQFDAQPKAKVVDTYDATDEKQYFVFYNVPNKAGHYYIYNKKSNRYLLPLQKDNEEVLTTDKKEKAGVYVLEHLGYGETLLRCVNAVNPAHPYLHLSGDKKLVCWLGKESEPSHWRIRPVGVESGLTAVKSAAISPSVSSEQRYDLSGRKVSQNYKGLMISKDGKTF